MNLIKAVKYKTALETFFNFLDIILKSLERCKISFEDLLAFSCNTNLAVLLDDTVLNKGTGDISDFRSLKYLAYLCVSGYSLFEDRSFMANSISSIA